MRKLYSVDKVTEMIHEGRSLALSGDERVLSQLPKGQWIGGTIPYFMNEEKGEFSQDQIFVNEVTSDATEVSIKSYDADSLPSLVSDRFDNGYTLLILPAFQPIHTRYAVDAPGYPGLYDTPIVGWVTGFELESNDVPKTYNGATGEAYTDRGVAFHVALPEDKMGSIDIINIHEERDDSVSISFMEDGFRVTDCLIDGNSYNFATYLDSNSIGSTAPLIADQGGAKINVCIKEVNTEQGYVDFYGPVFKGRTYKLAKAIDNYEEAFFKSIPDLDQPEEFSCNCILNYLYGNLESKKIGMTGPATFGEIAYILLNQTLVYLTVDDLK